MNAIIIDDEANARLSLRNLINSYCDEVEILGEASNIHDGFDLIEKKSPQIVFLDIEMPQGNGFKLLEKFDHIPFKIVFTTAYDEFALKAIKYSALDYLLKPIDIDELQLAVQKAASSSHPSAQQVNNLVGQVSGKHSGRIVIPDSDGMILIDVKDIIRCESDSNYTRFFLVGGRKIMASKTLREFEQMLEGESFFRIHRSHLINVKHLLKYVKGEGGHVIMSDESEVEVSRRKKSEFLSYIGGGNL